MNPILFLEVGGALFGGGLFYRELISKKFVNFWTAVFLLCYVPLYCLYPLFARFFVGGALSINKYQPGLIENANAYLVYQLANYGILLVVWLVRARFDDGAMRVFTPKEVKRFDVHYLVVILCVGVYLNIHSTGLTMGELLVADRFAWFSNENYSPLLSVISTYFIALAPVIVYLCIVDKRWRMLFFVLAVLTLNGILFKDRKWLIFIGSGFLAAQYVSAGRKLVIDAKVGGLILTLAMVLGFWQIARDAIFTALLLDEVKRLSMIPQMAIRLMTKGDIPYYYNASMTAIHMNISDGYEIPFGLLRRQLFFFLPAKFSGGLKIEDISAIFSDAIGGEGSNRRGNMPPGLFGLFVLSFNWAWGIVTLACLPLLVKYFDKLAKQGVGVVHAALISHALASIVFLLRGDDSSASYFIIFTILVLCGFRGAGYVFRKLQSS